MASLALRNRFRNTCWSLCSIPSTTAGSSANSRRTLIRCVANWCSSSASTSAMTAFTSSGARSDDASTGRERLSSPLTILAARNVCRSIFSSSRVRGSSGSAPSRSICVKLEIPVSGVLTSCATPAASRPIDAIFSEICSCSSSCTRAVTSSTMTIVPAPPSAAASAARSGTADALIDQRRSGVRASRRQREA